MAINGKANEKIVNNSVLTTRVSSKTAGAAEVIIIIVIDNRRLILDMPILRHTYLIPPVYMPLLKNSS